MKKYIKFILAIAALFGTVSHTPELTASCVLSLLILMTDLENDIEKLTPQVEWLKEKQKSDQREIEKLLNMIASKKGTENNKTTDPESILNEYDPKKIKDATSKLIASGLVDNESQALLNLEMDLEERRQLATGSGKKRKNS